MSQDLNNNSQSSTLKTKYINKRLHMLPSTTDLVPCSNVLLIAVDVNTLSDIRRLLLQGHQNIAGLIVKTCTGDDSSFKAPLLKELNQLEKYQKNMPHLCRSHHIQFGGWCPGLLSDSPQWHAMSPHQPTGSFQSWQQSLHKETKHTQK